MIFHEGYLTKEQVSKGQNSRYQIGEISNEMTLVSGNITRIIHFKNIKLSFNHFLWKSFISRYTHCFVLNMYGLISHSQNYFWQLQCIFMLNFVTKDFFIFKTF